MTFGRFIESLGNGWREMFEWLYEFELWGFGVLEFALTGFVVFSIARFVLFPVLGDRVGLRSFGRFTGGSSDKVKRGKND